jgi:class 3 adenylate cyclase
MSGFSRVTKEEGILYFLANVKQMQGICVPIMQARGGTLFKVVADNLFVMFEDPVQAVSAAADCIEAVMAYSEGKTRNEQIRYAYGGAAVMFPADT